MNPAIDPLVAALEDVQLTVDELARVCAVSRDWVDERVALGLLEACAADAAGPRFDASAVRRVRTMRSIELVFDAAPELAALVADLTDEITRLRAAVRSGLPPW